MKGSKELRNGTLYSDKKQELRDRLMWNVKGSAERNGKGSMHMVTEIGTQGMQGCVISEERKPLSRALD